MTVVPLSWFLGLAVALFVIGIAVVLTHRNLLRIWIGVQFVLQAAGLALVAIASTRGAMASSHAATLVLCMLMIAAAQGAVGFAIVAHVRRQFASSRAEDPDLLRE
jgi:NADH-quinone oxidoreductase subunit K